MSGNSTANAEGVYGSKGVASKANTPGGRLGANSWVDSSGNFWLFAGLGIDSTNSGGGILDDLWEFDTTNKEWIWMGGSSAGASGIFTSQPGVYGTPGTPAPSNVPGNRFDAVSWIDSSGNLWLFGGVGVALNGSSDDNSDLNDLWRYQP